MREEAVPARLGLSMIVCVVGDVRVCVRVRVCVCVCVCGLCGATHQFSSGNGCKSEPARGLNGSWWAAASAEGLENLFSKDLRT